MLLLEIANLVVNINMTNTGSKSLLTTINNQQSTIINKQNKSKLWQNLSQFIHQEQGSLVETF